MCHHHCLQNLRVDLGRTHTKVWVFFADDVDSVSMGSMNFLLFSNRNGYLGRHTYYRYSKISSPLVWPLVSDSCVNLRVYELVRERLLM